jgi:hypothetical protein
MMHHRALPLLSVLGMLALAACDKDGDPVAPTPERTGAIAGTVLIQDSAGYAPDHSGVSVGIEGTSLSTTSDRKGRWVISGVRAGVHTIVLSKQGYTTEYLIRQQFVGRDTLVVGPSNSVSISSFVVQWLPFRRVATFTAQAIADTSEGKVRISGSITSQAATQYVSIMFGSSPTVSKVHGTYLANLRLYTDGGGRFGADIPGSWLHGQGFVAGSVLHIVAYPGGDRVAYDAPTDRWYFSNLIDAPSQVATVVMP